MASVVGVGIDVAKAKVDVASSDAQLILEIPRTEKGLGELCEALSQLEVHRVVLEASGGYEAEVLAALHGAGFPVVLVQPVRARALAKGLGRRAKTDAIDAQVLAWMARFAVDGDPLWRPKSAELAKLHGLVFRRKQLVDIIDAETKRRRGATPAARASIERVLVVLKSEKKEVERLINELVAEIAEVAKAVEVLETPTGVGRVSATTILVTLPELGCATRREIAALAGVAPYNRDSGTQSGHRYIHGGRAAARKVLYMAALAGIKHNNPALRPLYERLVAKGKPKKVAIVACMRKLLIHLNSLMRRLRSEAPQVA